MSKNVSVFISYSRSDSSIADEVSKKLNSNSIETYIDSEQIDAGEEWQNRLSQLISKSHAVLYLISEHSIKSEVCSWEVNQAKRFSKRLFPIVVREVDIEKIPKWILVLNLTQLDSKEKYESEFAKLVNALKKDTSWHRKYAHLCELARLWNEGGHENKFLIRGQSVRDFERLLRERPQTVPANFEHVNEFLNAASKLEQSEIDWQRKIIQRGFVNQTANEIKRGYYDSAVRHLAAAAILSNDPNLELECDSDNEILRNSLWKTAAYALFSPNLVTGLFISKDETIERSVLGQEGVKFAAFNQSGEIFLWCVDNIESYTQLDTSELTIVKTISFHANDSILISSHCGGWICVWDVNKCDIVYKIKFHESSVYDVDSTGKLLVLARSAFRDKHPDVESAFLVLFNLENGSVIKKINHDHSLLFDSARIFERRGVVIFQAGFFLFYFGLIDGDFRRVDTRKLLKSEDNIAHKTELYDCDDAVGQLKIISLLQERFSQNDKSDKPAKIIFSTFDLGGICVFSYEIELISPYVRLIKKVGQNILLCSYDLIVKIDAKSGAELGRLNVLLGHNPLVVVERENKIALVASLNQVLLIDIESFVVNNFYSGHTGPVNSISISPKSDFFISSATSYVQPGEAYNHEYSDLYPRKYTLFLKKVMVVVELANIWCCFVLPKVNKIIAGIPNKYFLDVCLMNGKQNKYQIPSDYNGPYEISCFTKGSENQEIFGVALYVFFLKDRSLYDVRFFDLNINEFKKIQLPNDVEQVLLNRRYFSLLYASSFGELFYYDLARGKIYPMFKVHAKLKFMDLCHEGKNIILLDENDNLLVYCMGKYTEIGRVRITGINIKSGKVSCCGTKVVCASGDNLYFFELKSNGQFSLYHKAVEQTNFMGGKISFGIHPENHIAYSSNWYLDDIYIWDMSTGALISKLPGNKGVYCLHLDADNNILYVGSKVGLVQWDLSQFDCLLGRRGELISSRLKSGRGNLSFSERRNVLFCDLPDSLSDSFEEISLKNSSIYE